jgi:hypothetical protein
MKTQTLLIVLLMVLGGAATGQDARPPKNTTSWGKAIDGVEYGVTYKDKPGPFRIGDDVTFVLTARNVSAKRVQFDQVEIYNFQSDADAVLPTAVDAKGKETKAFAALIPDVLIRAKVRKVELAPRETKVLGEISVCIGPFNNGKAGLDIKPGTYRVRFDTVCSGAKRPTGALQLIVLR